MAALQICSRCRKRKIRCDLQLPSCRNCTLADVDCVFWDDTLRQEIPCSYLHSLRQKVASLEAQVQHASDRQSSLPEGGQDAPSARLIRQCYHLGHSDLNGAPSLARASYLGSGNSARLLERLLKSTVDRHLVNDVAVPRRLLRDERRGEPATHVSDAPQSFQICEDQKKVDLHCSVPLVTQRALIAHYTATLAPEFNIPSTEQQSSLIAYENPLKWASTNKDDPGVLPISIVFSLSAALVARDLDPNLLSTAMRCREQVLKFVQKDEASDDLLGKLRLTCTALCALALFELIRPTSGHLWDFLGRAADALEGLYEGYQLKGLGLDGDFLQIKGSLLKLDLLAAQHFRRPSCCHTEHTSAIFHKIGDGDPFSDDITVLRTVQVVSTAFALSPRQPEQFFEDLIPAPLRVHAARDDIAVHSAAVYVALHPLYTSAEALSDGTLLLGNGPPRLFHTIACSARAIIEHFARLNEANKIVSIWMAADRVIEAGAVWMAYLMSQIGASPTSTTNLVAGMSPGLAMSPIIKVSSLLASFAARWKGGAGYIDAWETCVELLWNIL